MIRTLGEHEFIENQQGQLALLVPYFEGSALYEPALLVSPKDNEAFLRRAGKEFYHLEGINLNVIDQVRESATVMVVEMDGDEIAASYDVPVGVLAPDFDEPKET